MSAGAECREEHCITCGDVADEMTVLRLDLDRGLALCADGSGAHHSVETALVEPVSLGDELLVHAGTGIANLGPQETSHFDAPGRVPEHERVDHLDAPGREAEHERADTPGREAEGVSSL